ncbi:MAG: type VII secretion protein EccB [Actinomycetes bacterium]
MASKRDLVEANSFNRRRLVTAFVSGAPGGREVDPQSPARAIVVGIVLAVLVVGGATLAGVLKPTLPADWGDNSLVVGKATGARYLAVDEALYPVVNTTSARLLVEAGQFKVVFAPEAELEDKPHGSTIGILGAPDALPDDERLIQTGWVSCLDQRGRTKLTVSSRNTVRRASGTVAVVVSVRGTTHVVTAGHRYPVEGELDRTLLALGLENETVMRAPGEWADLFPAGPPLHTVQVPEAGEPVPSSWHLPSEASVYGQVVELDGGERRFLLRRSGLVPLSAVGFAMYQVSQGDLADPVPVDQGDVTGVNIAGQNQPYPGQWPTELPTSLDDTAACAELQAGTPGEAPHVALATPRPALPTGDAGADPLPSSSSTLPAVEPGAGALVRSVSGGARGTVVLVDSSGRRYALGAPEEQVRAQLGYGAIEPTTVFPAWLEALENGPELSPEAASHRVPGSVGGAG